MNYLGYDTDGLTSEQAALFSQMTLDASGNIVITGLTLPTNVLTDTNTKTVSNKTLTSPTITTIISGSQTLTLPAISDTIVTKNSTDVLINKTITFPIISQIRNSGTISLPTSTTTLVGTNTTDTLSNKTLSGPVIDFINNSGSTGVASQLYVIGNCSLDGRLFLQNPGQSSYTTLGASGGVDGYDILLPAADTTLVGTNTTDTLTNKIIVAPILDAISNNGLTTVSNNLTVLGDFFVNGTSTSNVSASLDISGALLSLANGNTSSDIVNIGYYAFSYNGAVVKHNGLIRSAANAKHYLFNDETTVPTTTSDLTTFSKGNLVLDTLYPTTISGGILSGCTAANIINTGTVSFPTASDTLVGKSTTDVFINKTLTGNTALNFVNAGTTITLPAANDTLVGKSTTDIFINKTLTGNTALDFINSGNTVTLPASNDTLVGKSTTDVFINKTLTGNVALNFVNSGNTITLPASNDTLVGKSTTDVFINKTLTGNVALNFVNAGTTITLPASNDTMVGKSTTDTLNNKNLASTTTFVVDTSDPTKKVKFNLAGMTTGVTTTLQIAQASVNSNVNIWANSGTLVGSAIANTFLYNQIFMQDNTDNPILFRPNGYNFGVGLRTDETDIPTGIRTITLPNATGTVVLKNSSDILTNKTLTGNTALNFVNAGTTITLPAANDTLVGKSTTDVFINKTLTGNTALNFVNSGNTITLPTSSDTLVGKSTTDVFINKTLTGNTAANFVNSGTITLPNSSATLATLGLAETITGLKTFSTMPLFSNKVYGMVSMMNNDATSTATSTTATKITTPTTSGLSSNTTLSDNKILVTDTSTRIYRVTFTGAFQTASTAHISQISIAKNGTVINSSVVGCQSTDTSNRTPFSLSVLVSMTANDYVEMYVRENSGTGAITIPTGQLILENIT